MDLLTLEKTVKQGEGLLLEFKKYLPEPLRLAKEAIALANTRGGKILLGVDDDGTLTGIKDPDEAVEMIRHWFEQFIHPAITYELELTPLTRKRSVLSILLPESKSKPHLLVENERDKGQGFYRLADRSIQASRELVEILRHEGKNKNIKIEFGEKEKILLKYLGEHPSVTLEEFANMAGITRYTASRTLVHLVRGNVIRIQPGEGGDLYLHGESF